MLFFLLNQRIVVAKAFRVYKQQSSWIQPIPPSGQLLFGRVQIFFCVDEHFSIELEPTVPKLIPEKIQSLLTRPEHVHQLFPRIGTTLRARHWSEHSLASIAWLRRAVIK
jgi:hypothetical protein